MTNRLKKNVYEKQEIGLEENKDYIKNNVKYLLIEIHEFIMYKGYEKKCLDIIKESNMKLMKKDGISFLFENEKL